MQELAEFLRTTQAEVREQGESPYTEVAFTEVVMGHMAEIGMTNEPVACPHESTIGNARLRLSGFAISEESDCLDLFVSLYEGVDELVPVTDTETKKAAEQCLQFLKKCVEGSLTRKLDESNDAHGLALTIQGSYDKLEQIRIFVLTDRVAKTKNFKPREIGQKTVMLEVMDIERLYRHWAAGKPRDELVADLEQLSGTSLPCVYLPGGDAEFDCVLTALPGEMLRAMYEQFGSRLLEANVRSFLSATGKVNKGIRDTISTDPAHFLAYNNGLVIIADEVNVVAGGDGGSFLRWMKGVQIVNGGQTTASIYFTKKRNPAVDLGKVRVPAKIIVLRSNDGATEESLISAISKYANSQNAVKQADLSANKPFHVELEKLSQSVYCPDGTGRWFYERAAGSYNVWLAREGSTPTKVRKLREAVPTSRRITKTDLAKYLNSWEALPHIVSQGAQKNFLDFMKRLESEPTGAANLDAAMYRQMIAKAILFKETSKIARKRFKSFQANIAAYTVSVIAVLIGDRLDLERIWRQQGLSSQLEAQVLAWATEVEKVLNSTARGRMISEWAKKPECWEAVRAHAFPELGVGIPEIR